MRGLIAAVILLLLPVWAGAEENGSAEDILASLELDAWQEAADGAGAQIDVAGLVRSLSQGDTEWSPERLMELLRGIVLGEADGMYGQLTAFVAPALLWAVNRQLLSRGRLGNAAGYVCYLAGAGAMLAAFASHMELARGTIQKMGRLTGQVFPVLTALMSASGHAGTAGMLQPLAAFGGGALALLVERIASVLCGGAAVLAVAGNLSERMELKGLFGLCCSVCGWLLGGIMTAFLGMTAMCGVMGSAQDSVTLRAARYAVDSLLPVVGGDVADAMDGMASSAALVRSAAGVTGVIVMLSVCLRPVIRLALGMLACRLAAALTEPVADGPLKKCAQQLGQATQLLLAAVAVSAALFVTLTGVCIGAR